MRWPPPKAPTARPPRSCAPRRRPSPTSARPAPASRRAWKAPATVAARRPARSAISSTARRTAAWRWPSWRPTRCCLDSRRPTRCCTRLKADRERLGGVNLQADDDLTTMTEQFEGMDKEKCDVEEAIAKLRTGISQINDEGQSRLQAGLRHRQRPLPAPVLHPVRRRRGAARDGRGRGSAGERAGDRRQAARQEAGDAVPAVGRRAVADRVGADLRRVPHQPVADLRAGRGRRAAR